MGHYICFEGSEGVGKTTQVLKLVESLRLKGFSVLQTKEPGTEHSPLTLELRKLILDAQYDEEGGWVKLDLKIEDHLKNQSFQSEMTKTAKEYLKVARLLIVLHKRMTTEARELILQSVRSIHLEKVVAPALKQYDYVVQDRGILSGLAYGEAGGVDLTFMNSMNDRAVKEAGISQTWQECFSQVIMLRGNVSKGLSRAQSAKKEFESDDVMEKRGVSYLEKVNNNFTKHLSSVKNVAIIVVDDKTIDEVSEAIQKVLP